MKRRTFIKISLSAAACPLGGRAAGAEATDPALYAKDVEFLLEQLPEQAGRFFPIKKIVWEAVEAEFREAVKSVKTDGDHVKLCGRLMARLEDGHASLRDLKVRWPDESGGRRWTGPRVHLVVIGGKVHVRTAFGPALESGISPGQEMVSVNGVPAREWLDRKVAEMRDASGFSTDHMALYAACHWGLADWEGTEITFEVRPPDGGKMEKATITRRGGPNFAPFGPVFPPRDLKQEGRQSYGRTAGGFGYIHLRNIPGDLPEQLDKMLGDIGDVPGLILDLRANGGGGCDHEAVMGRFLAPGKPWANAASQGPKPFTGPMVVIYDAGVRSAGETIAGMFKEDGGRAYTIGDTPTAGTSSQKVKLPVPSGLFSVYFSVASNKARFNGGRGIEGIGMSPAEITPYDAVELQQGIDTQIRRAEELLGKGFPDGVVGYRID